MKLKGSGRVMRTVLIVLLTWTPLTEVSGVNILFYFAYSGYSHRLSVWPIIEKLVGSGHQITFLSPYSPKIPTNTPNVTDFVPTGLSDRLGHAGFDFIGLRVTQGVGAVRELWNMYFNAGIASCEFLMGDPATLKWIDKASFDLVVVNGLYNECGFGLAHKFGAPYVVHASTNLFHHWTDAYGIPEENLPETQYFFPENMTFFQEVWNALRPFYWQWKRYWTLFPRLETALRKGLNMPDMPPLAELEKRTSLNLINLHFSEEFPRSLPPLVVSVGGTHCHDRRKPLPKDVAEFLDGAKEGFILLSFGTYMNLANLPQELLSVFLDAMAAVGNIRFLVLCSKDIEHVEIPGNVKTVRWINQQDVIAHPLIRAFISHGGLLGTQEAVYHAVPMIVIPLFAEQDYNAERIHARGRGIRLEIQGITKQKLETAIRDILNDPGDRFKRTVKRVSKLFRDRPRPPVDEAVWWIEYVLRNKDTSHLQPVGIHKNWIQLRMLHIWPFVLLIILLTSSTLSLLIWIVIKKASSCVKSPREPNTDVRRKNRKKDK